MEVNGLLLHGSLEPLDGDIVQVSALAIHGDFDLCLGQCLNPICAHILAALISIHDLRFAAFFYGLPESLNTKAWIQRVG